MKVILSGLPILLLISGCAEFERGLKDAELVFASDEERVAHWRQECEKLGAPEAEMWDCIQKQQELYQIRRNSR